MKLLEARLKQLQAWPGLAGASGADGVTSDMAPACIHLLRLLVHTDAERLQVRFLPLSVVRLGDDTLTHSK